jgi:arginine/lysine/ornithine decarboxylase
MPAPISWLPACKMGATIEQGSVFHLQHDRVNPDVLSAREDLLGTTSSSSLVYLTLDGWRLQMVEHGEELLGTALERARRVRDAVHAMSGIDLIDREVVGPAMDVETEKLLVDALRSLVDGAASIERPPGFGRVCLRSCRGRHHALRSLARPGRRGTRRRSWLGR